MCGGSHEGSLPAGTIEITILPDGRVKIDTGNFAGASHASAQAAIPAIAAALGVTIEAARKRVAQALSTAEHTTKTRNVL